MMKINSLMDSIPLPIRLFLGKALLFFIIWKLVYSFFLFDSQLLDKPLTSHVGNISTQILNSTGLMSGFTAKNQTTISQYRGGELNDHVSTIYHDNKKVLYIGSVCNGLELIILYIGFIICMPSGVLRKIKYIIIGMVILDFTNIIRCVGLIYLREYFEAYFQFAHHYLFKMVVYLTTFLIWIYYCRKIKINNEPLQIQ